MSKKSINYKEAVQEIDEIVSYIESSDVDIDMLTEKLERATFLIKACKEKLQKTEIEVENILKELNKE